MVIFLHGFYRRVYLIGSYCFANVTAIDME